MHRTRCHSCISIHSLRMEGDSPPFFLYYSTKYFNPLPPHGGRPVMWRAFRTHGEFQSTPSAWRETPRLDTCDIGIQHFNPLPPHGGRPMSCCCWRMLRYFNPLPPHGGRHLHVLEQAHAQAFQSTPSAWRETVFLAEFDSISFISIHSLRMEGDTRPRSGLRWTKSFQSTPSAWRETSFPLSSLSMCINFNPLPPHGGRHFVLHSVACAFRISIHSLRMEGDFEPIQASASWSYFNPLPPHGGRRCTDCV